MLDNAITNILLIEDNPGDARLVKMMLSEPAGVSYCLMMADSLAAAKILIDEHDFHIAILDMSLPDGDGEEGISYLKSCSPDMPIVVLSGRDDEHFALEMVQAGAQDYLVKGQINQWQLMRAINYAIERKNWQEEMVRMAHHDQLTGLVNRSLFRTRVEHALKSAERRRERVIIFYIDLDQFKHVNDALGHDIGDQLLISVAERLQESVREIDTVARLGGDEFAILLEGVENINGAISVANKILEKFSDPVEIDEHILYAGTSIGIAYSPECGEDVDQLIKNADSAMYKAKQNGRNQYQFYTDHINQNSLSALNMETKLRSALDNDEFLLHYQPKLDATNGRISGHEALLRWQHSDQGLVYPQKFIPLLEQNGLISEVGRWVLQTACEQHRDWKNQGLAVGKVAVNLSGQQLLQRKFSQSVEDILVKSGLEPDSLEIELTESLLIKNTKTTCEILEELKSMGVSIAIDDFGTGYSSFSYLKRFMIDTLKIDRSFITNIIENPKDRAITMAICRLAHDLGIHVVAEGVETEAQRQCLNEQMVDEIQGFLISPPLASNDFSDFVNKGSLAA